MEERYTLKQLKEKYNWDSNIIPEPVKYAKARGVIIKLDKNSLDSKPYYYFLIDDTIANLNWIVSPTINCFELTKEGYIRYADSKRIITGLTSDGYILARDKKGKAWLGHRLIMDAFNPVSDSEKLFVDHINGVRTDNNINNLRWATPAKNMTYMHENWKDMQDKFNQLLQNIGYEKMNELLDNELKKIKK